MNISENILSLLNGQYRHEMSNHFRYEQRRAWADFKGFNNVAEFFNIQADGEKDHAGKVMAYILDRSAIARIEPFSFSDPSPDFAALDLPGLFASALVVEQDTTAALSAIYKSAIEEGDYLTAAWLFKDLIPEQVEEEKIYQSIIDRFAAFPASPSRDHDIDVWIGETFVDE